jgi:hypothetical protein
MTFDDPEAIDKNLNLDPQLLFKTQDLNQSFNQKLLEASAVKVKVDITVMEKSAQEIHKIRLHP